MVKKKQQHETVYIYMRLSLGGVQPSANLANMKRDKGQYLPAFMWNILQSPFFQTVPAVMK